MQAQATVEVCHGKLIFAIRTKGVYFAPRPFFVNTPLAGPLPQLVYFFCQLSAGPCSSVVSWLLLTIALWLFSLWRFFMSLFPPVCLPRLFVCLISLFCFSKRRLVEKWHVVKALCKLIYQISQIYLRFHVDCHETLEECLAFWIFSVSLHYKRHDYIYISEIFFSNQAYNKHPEFDRPNIIERLVFLKVAKAMTEQGIV